MHQLALPVVLVKCQSVNGCNFTQQFAASTLFHIFHTHAFDSMCEPIRHLARLYDSREVQKSFTDVGGSLRSMVRSRHREVIYAAWYSAPSLTLG